MLRSVAMTCTYNETERFPTIAKTIAHGRVDPKAAWISLEHNTGRQEQSSVMLWLLWDKTEYQHSEDHWVSERCYRRQVPD